MDTIGKRMMGLFGWLPAVPAGLEFIVVVGGAASVIYGAYRAIYKPLRGFMRKWDKGLDSLVGFPAITDPASGRELKPATPPLSHRVSTLEDAFSTMIQTQKDIAGIQSSITEIQADLTRRESEGLMIIDEWTKWREKHEEEASRREERFAEWEQWRSEQTLMVEAMKNSHGLPHKE